MNKRVSLTALQIDKLIRQGKAGQYAAGDNLYLSISKGKTASWLFRFKLDKKSYWMGLGSVNAYNTLSRKRAEAQKLKAMVADGINPLEVKRREKEERIREAERAEEEAERKLITFRTCAAACIASKEPGWKNKKHVQQWRNTLETYAFPVIRDMHPADIDNTHILEILKPIWTAKTETATRVRTRIESVLFYAAALKYRSSENPAQWRGKPGGPAAKAGRHGKSQWGCQAPSSFAL